MSWLFRVAALLADEGEKPKPDEKGISPAKVKKTPVPAAVVRRVRMDVLKAALFFTLLFPLTLQAIPRLHDEMNSAMAEAAAGRGWADKQEIYITAENLPSLIWRTLLSTAAVLRSDRSFASAAGTFGPHLWLLQWMAFIRGVLFLTLYAGTAFVFRFGARALNGWLWGLGFLAPFFQGWLVAFALPLFVFFKFRAKKGAYAFAEQSGGILHKQE